MKKRLVILILIAAVLSIPAIGFCERVWKGGMCPYWNLSVNWVQKSVPSYIDLVIIGEGENFSPAVRYDQAFARMVVIKKGGTLTLESDVLVIGK